MKIVILGSSSHFPMKSRNHPGIFVSIGGKNILIDCGEGIQRQMRIAGISPTKLDYILITHWHGDHMLGLGGILYSLESMEYKKELNIILPRENFDDLKKILEGLRINLSFKINLIEAKEGLIIEERDFYIYGFELKHTVKNFGYIIKEKDKIKIDKKKLEEFNIKNIDLIKKLKNMEKIIIDGKEIDPNNIIYIKKGIKLSYVTDTLFFPEIINNVKDSDILIMESSFFFQPDLAQKHYHLDYIFAREIFRESNSKILLLTHISQRYEKEIDNIERQILENEENIYILHDFDEINYIKDKIILKINKKEYIYIRDNNGNLKKLR